MKKFKLVTIAGTIIAVTAILFALRGGRKGRTDLDKQTGIPFQATSYDSQMLQQEGIEPYLGDLSFLTEDEKAQLLRDEEELRPIFKKMTEIEEKIQSLRDSVLDKNRDLLDREEELLSQGNDLRDRIVAEFPTDQITTENWRKYIKASKTLNEEERKKLLQLEDELEELDGNLQQVYDEVDRVVAPYEAEWEEYDKKVNDIYERSRRIHDKIYENNVESKGFQAPIPISTHQ